MRNATVFMAVVLAVFLVRFFQEILAPLVVATFLLLLIDAVQRWLQNRLPTAPGWARGGVAAILILAAFAAVTGLLVEEGPSFASEMQALGPKLNSVIVQESAVLGSRPMTLQEIFSGGDPSRILAKLFGAARSLVSYAGLVVIYLGFLAASNRVFGRKLDQLYSTDDARGSARRVFASIRNAVEQYVRLQTFKALLIAGSAMILMLVLGVANAPFVAFVVFLAVYVPIVGPIAGTVFPALVALAQYGTIERPAILLAGLGTAVFVIDNILMPKLQSDELNIDPLLVLLSIGFWGSILGWPGVLLSTPLTVTVMAIAAEFDSTRWLAILISRDGHPIRDARSA